MKAQTTTILLAVLLVGCVSTSSQKQASWRNQIDQIEALISARLSAEALPLATNALAFAKGAWGEKHRNTAISLTKVAWLARDLGLEDIARESYDRAWKIWWREVIPDEEIRLGEIHPTVADDYRRVATVFFNCGLDEHGKEAFAKHSRIMSLLACTNQVTSGDFSDWIFPSAYFYSHDRTTPESIRKYVDDMHRKYGTNDITLEIALEIPSDPFYTKPFESVSFRAPSYGPMIGEFYQERFAAESWEVIRENQFILEELNHLGWEWFRVYKKGQAMIRVRVIGTRDEEGVMWNNSSISMDFIGIEPEALLGENYTMKGTEPYDPSYHILREKEYRYYLDNRTNGWTLLPEAAPLGKESP